MAEIKNTFLQSKMNKDLDDRLIPNGQYRDALNIQIGKSEQDDIGALQSVLGNSSLPIPADDSDLICIGFFMDNQNNRIYRFLTNYIDANPNSINYPDAADKMKISVYDINSQTYTTLVSGIFLNFSANNSSYINGVNLIENLLFWTDNRNQPRKINVNTALVNPGYYTTETQISVAKYAPVEPISLIKKSVTTVTNVISPNEIEVDDATGIVVGMTIISGAIDSTEFVTVYEVAGNNITLYQDTTLINIGDTLTFLISTMTDQSGDENWPGDPDFLEDKYVRFSYIFRYDDGEYSLMAPFTQIAYIPRQKGYFINGDETAAYRSTIVRWMENNVNNIELLIPLPDKGSNIVNSYKITELDILYKESNSNAVKVIETVTTQRIASESPNINVFVRPYQSQKPYKTLTEDQTTRVTDIVPVRALAQEVTGNRVMYGNYYSTYTAPSSINYNVTVSPKTFYFTSFIEYPNHTLKQNRNYQVGFILSDKFGRQSPVILSTVDLTTVSGGAVPTLYGGSTVYAPYVSKEAGYPPTRDWNGNALLVLLNSVITSTRNIPNGTPGLYAEAIGGVGGFTVNGFSVVNGNDYQFVIDSSVSNSPPKKGDYLRGEYTDYVEITELETFGDLYILTTDGQANNLYNLDLANDPDIKYAYRLNPIGWYSYKIVVRQQEQDYYNVYLPGMLNAYPLNQTYGSQVVYIGDPTTPTLQNGINTSDFPTNEFNKTAHIVLINDNINKVPRDLTEVGPDQKQYRSSVELFGRVENDVTLLTFEVDPVVDDPSASQFIYDSVMLPNIFPQISVGDAINYESPEPWYANTVITEILEDTPTVGKCTIKFSPDNITVEDFDTISILLGKNKQYYPTRKPDTVSSIANSRDFDFLPNSVENIIGTAGLNLYQLQTNPMIGRVSTISGIGIEGQYMVPYLGVYETRPDESLLDLFWETATTGLISDLNWDVLTGSDAPVALNDFEYLFFEDQDKNGSESGTGDADSPYITENIYAINNSGAPIIATDAQIVSVFDNSIPANSCASRFAIEPSGLGQFKIKIADSFVFNHNALTAGLFNFEIQLQYNGVWYPFSFQIPLGNRAPRFTNEPFDNTINRTTTIIETLTAVNGSFTNATTDLYWEITSGNDEGYFAINDYTGEFSLIRSDIPNGIYTIGASVTDAVDFTQVPPLKLNGVGAFQSLTDTTTFTIVVVGDPLTPCLRDFDSDVLCYQNSPYGRSSSWTYDNIPKGFGAVYVGKKDIMPLADGITWPDLPNCPLNGQKYQNAMNVAKANGCTTLTGLTQGTMRWDVEYQVGISDTTQGPNCIGSIRYESIWTGGRVRTILWYRENENAVWQTATDDNGFNCSIESDPPISTGFSGAKNMWSYNTPMRLELRQAIQPRDDLRQPGDIYTGSIIVRSFSFFTSEPGEYCLCVYEEDMSGDSLGQLGAACYSPNGIGPFARVKISDANFTYPLGVQTRTAYKYNLRLSEPFDNNPTALASNQQVSNKGQIAWGGGAPDAAPLYEFELELTVKEDQVEPDKVVVTQASLDAIQPALLVPGVRCINDDHINPGTVRKIANISGTTITFDGNTDSYFLTGDIITATYNTLEVETEVWSDSADGINVKQFYTGPDMLVSWEPPMADKFYTFRKMDRDYNLGDHPNEFTYQMTSTRVSSYVMSNPFWTAKFDINGKVIPISQSNPPRYIGGGTGLGSISAGGNTVNIVTCYPLSNFYSPNRPNPSQARYGYDAQNLTETYTQTGGYYAANLTLDLNYVPAP